MNNSNCWRDPQGNASNPEAHPFRATLYFVDNGPGLHGWSSRSQVFATLDEALLVATCLMGRGCYRVDVDVAKNRSTWTTNGYWEAVGRRKIREDFRWSKKWSAARAVEVRNYLNSKGIS
jgi:hypothetical protein